MLDLTPLFRLYARRRLARLAAEDAVATQRATLLALLRRAAPTRFGRAHGFAAIDGVAAFQDRVPLRRYEEFWRDWWQPAFPALEDCSWPGRVPYLALSSGTTTGATKHIPCSAAMVRANRRAALEVLVHHLAHRPASRVLGGKSFLLGGSTDLREVAPGLRAGDLSGIAVGGLGRWARGRVFPERAVALMTDWEAKIERLAAAAPHEDIRVLAGTPSWLLAFLDRLAALHRDRPPRLASWFPRLELLVHGGVDFRPYRRRFDELLAGGAAELREVYAASEGFVAVADRGPGEGMRLLLDNGLFFEFVPVEELGAARPTRHWIADAEPGVNYALVLSSCAGLFAYVLGDTVRLVERRPPRLLVTGRTGYMLSAFGEHLIGEEIEAAVAAAAEGIGRSVVDYAVAPRFPERPGELGRHHYLVEFAGASATPAELAAFAGALDRALAAANEDYRAHRAGGLAAPEIRAAPAGAFMAWMKKRGKLGGQHKVPRIVNDPDLAGDLESFVGALSTEG